MKTRLKEVRATHWRASHISPSIISIHVISIVWGGGSRGDEWSVGVGIVVVRSGLLMGVMRAGERLTGDCHWLGSGAGRGYWNGSSTGLAGGPSRPRGMGGVRSGR